jgi:hypothetical protein
MGVCSAGDKIALSTDSKISWVWLILLNAAISTTSPNGLEGVSNKNKNQ